MRAYSLYCIIPSRLSLCSRHTIVIAAHVDRLGMRQLKCVLAQRPPAIILRNAFGLNNVSCRMHYSFQRAALARQHAFFALMVLCNVENAQTLS